MFGKRDNADERRAQVELCCSARIARIRNAGIEGDARRSVGPPISPKKR